MSELHVGPKLDAIVGQVIFKRPVRTVKTRGGRDLSIYADVEVDEPAEWHWFQAEIPPFSTNITAAWQVVERMEGLGYNWAMHSALYGVEARFMPLGSDQGGWVLGNGAPRAICLAALAVLEVPA